MRWCGRGRVDYAVIQQSIRRLFMNDQTHCPPCAPRRENDKHWEHNPERLAFTIRSLERFQFIRMAITFGGSTEPAGEANHLVPVIVPAAGTWEPISAN